jgi:hypothetical protein
MTEQVKKTVTEALIEVLKLFILMGWITIMLWITATKFDASELKALSGIAIGLGGAKAISMFSSVKN